MIILFIRPKKKKNNLKKFFFPRAI
jgi:hypothetical protein